MNTLLFEKLIHYISDKEDSSYFRIWGKRFLSRLRGKPATFSTISSDESVNTKRDYETIKLRVPASEDLDSLLLMCDRGIKKYESSGHYFKFFRIILIGGSLLLAQAVNMAGEFEMIKLEKDNAESIIANCITPKTEGTCKDQMSEAAKDKKLLAAIVIKFKGFIFILLGAFIGFMVIGVMGNDNKGRSHLEILALYLNRLKEERDGSPSVVTY